MLRKSLKQIKTFAEIILTIQIKTPAMTTLDGQHLKKWNTYTNSTCQHKNNCSALGIYDFFIWPKKKDLLAWCYDWISVNLHCLPRKKDLMPRLLMCSLTLFGTFLLCFASTHWSGKFYTLFTSAMTPTQPAIASPLPFRPVLQCFIYNLSGDAKARAQNRQRSRNNTPTL